MPKVLIVDDHPDIRRLIALTLSRQYEILETDDGRQGLEMLASTRPDAVVLDIMMPEMDGLEVLQRIRADPSYDAMVVVMVTARGQHEDHRQAIELGADAYLTKPFSPFELASVIDEHLHSRQRHRLFR